MPPLNSVTVIGVRTAPQQIRYAIVTRTDDIYTFVNKASENSIQRPAEISDDDPYYLRWAKDEISRILRQNPEVSRLALKTSEFRGNENHASRLSNHLDASVIIAACEAGLPVIRKLYSQLATTRSKVKEHAESRVGRSQINWNEQMADAVAIAWMTTI